jgi:hypothetical protein
MGTCGRIRLSVRGSEKLDVMDMFGAVGVTASGSAAVDVWLAGLRAGTSNRPGLWSKLGVDSESCMPTAR